MKITCYLYKKNFKDIFDPNTNQAYGCASDIYTKDEKYYIISHYGSEFDGFKFDWINKQNKLPSDGIVCDDCIKKMLQEKNLIKDETFDYIK